MIKREEEIQLPTGNAVSAAAVTAVATAPAPSEQNTGCAKVDQFNSHPTNKQE